MNSLKLPTPGLVLIATALLTLLAGCGTVAGPTTVGPSETTVEVGGSLTSDQAVFDDLTNSGIAVTDVARAEDDPERLIFTIGAGETFYQEALLRVAVAARQAGLAVNSVEYEVVDIRGTVVDSGGFTASDLDEQAGKLKNQEQTLSDDEVNALLEKKLSNVEYPAGASVTTQVLPYVAGSRMLRVDVTAVEADVELITGLAAAGLQAVMDVNGEDSMEVAVFLFVATDKEEEVLLSEYHDLELGLQGALWANEGFMPGWVSPPPSA